MKKKHGAYNEFVSLFDIDGKGNTKEVTKPTAGDDTVLKKIMEVAEKNSEEVVEMSKNKEVFEVLKFHNAYIVTNFVVVKEFKTTLKINPNETVKGRNVRADETVKKSDVFTSFKKAEAYALKKNQQLIDDLIVERKKINKKIRIIKKVCKNIDTRGLIATLIDRNID